MSLEDVYAAVESEIPHLDKHYPNAGWDFLVVGLQTLSTQMHLCLFTTGEQQVLPMLRRGAGLICRHFRSLGENRQVVPYGSRLSLSAYITLFDFYARRITDCAAQGSRGNAVEYVMVAYGILFAAMREHGAPLANRLV